MSSFVVEARYGIALPVSSNDAIYFRYLPEPFVSGLWRCDFLRDRVARTKLLRTETEYVLKSSCQAAECFPRTRPHSTWFGASVR